MEQHLIGSSWYFQYELFLLHLSFSSNSPPCEGGQGDVPLVLDERLSHVKVSPVLWNIPLPPSQGGLR